MDDMFTVLGSVSKGDVIGTVEDTGLGSGDTYGTYYHNHFEMRVGAQCPIGSSGSNASKSVFNPSNSKDPDVNPLLFLENSINDNNSLRYSVKENLTNNKLLVTVFWLFRSRF
jgi:murein DD-endopeptidase MepM/ murein hydrolase activator NlpD